jgi:hypothetical protein|tara:strand:- start:4659 stop:5039 length:381 start_codon:yes stop_codon:yes gene_type:complete
MSLKAALRKVADTAIKKVGGDVTVNFVTRGAYNTTTGEVAESITSETVKGVLDDVKKSELNDLAYGANKVGHLQIDKRLTVSALSLGSEPLPDDKVTIESKIYQIVTVETIEQDNEAIVYDIYLRA